MSYIEHKKGGNCPKSKSSNWGTRKSYKLGASKLRRKNNKKVIKQQMEESEK